MLRKYAPLVLTLGVTLGALAWIAAANLIDSTLMVAGRVIDSAGRPLENIVVRVEVGNRAYEDETNAAGCFLIRTMTGPFKHESQLMVARLGAGFASPLLRISLPAPARHFLQVTVPEAGRASVETKSPEKLSDLCGAAPRTRPAV